MARIVVIISIAGVLLGALQACADREQLETKQVAEQADLAAADDVRCREKGEPGTKPYDDCREGLAADRAKRATIDYQKARDFDRVLGEGTSGASDKY
jgi:hypothetical protein